MNSVRPILATHTALRRAFIKQVRHSAVAQTSWKRLISQAAAPPTERVCIVGSGNFGSAMSTIIGRNAASLPFVHDQVNMWVHEEQIKGRNLSDIINDDHGE
jgi:hypothetical protein